MDHGMMSSMLDQFTEAQKRVVEFIDVFGSAQARLSNMLGKYGEACSMTTAGKIIGRSCPTIRKMLDDGRLRWACAGTRVDVRSICEYIEAPKEIDYEVRLVQRRQKAGIECKWHV